MKKTITAWFIVTSSLILLAACSKNQSDNNNKTQELADHTSSNTEHNDQLKINTIRKMYDEDRENVTSVEVLYPYSTNEFRAWLDMTNQFPEETCGYSHDILTQSQDSANIENNFSYSLSPEGSVKVDLGQQSVTYELACNSNNCLINDVIESDGRRISETINKDCSALRQSYAEQQALKEQIKLTYRFDTQTTRLGNNYVTLNNLIISSEFDLPVDIQQVQVNRGNCAISTYSGQNHILNFGQTYKVSIECHPRDVKEVNITLDDGLELIMKPMQ